MKAFGFSLTLSDLEHALWWDSDQHQQAKARGWGLVLSLRGGDVVRPFGGQWFGPDFPRRVLRFSCPLPVLPFISVALGRYGFYIGFKTFGADDRTYLLWPGHVFTEADMMPESMALCPSIRFTRNRGR